MWRSPYHIEPLREDRNYIRPRVLESRGSPSEGGLGGERVGAPRGVAIARLAALFTGDNMIPLSEFPAIDATLNATSALLLTLGYFFIRRKKIQAHKVCMLSAFATSSLFLGCYIWYHAHHGVTRFA